MDLEESIAIAQDCYRTVTSSLHGNEVIILPDYPLAVLLESTRIAREHANFDVPDRSLAAHYAFQKLGCSIPTVLAVIGFELDYEAEEVRRIEV